MVLFYVYENENKFLKVWGDDFFYFAIMIYVIRYMIL